jgi:hypothetical protein
LSDQQASTDASPPNQPPIIPLVSWGVAKIKGKLHKRRAEREKETAEDRSSRRTATATVWIAIFAVIAAFVGISQAIIGNRQLTAMQGQLNAMEAEQRPWIATTIELAGDLIIGNQGAQIKVKYTLENTGHAPAFNVVPIPSIVANVTYTGGFMTIFPQMNFFGPVDPIKEVKHLCDKYAPNLSDALQRGVTILFGNTIFPQKTFTKTEGAIIDFQPLPNVPPSLTVTPPRYIMDGSAYLASCVDYRVGEGTVHHQTGDVFFLDRVSPDDPQKTISIDLPKSEVIHKDDLRLFPEALGAYAN